MSSMDLLWIADRNATAVSFLEKGFRTEACSEFMGAFREVVHRRKRDDLDDDCDVQFEDGSYRCFNDAPLKSPYDNDTYSIAISNEADQLHGGHPIYSSAFVLGGDIPVVTEAVWGVVLMNLALWYHIQGLEHHQKSRFAFRKAKVLYQQAYCCMRTLFKDKPILKESIALRVLVAAICYNLSNLYWFVYCDSKAALSLIPQFRYLLQSMMKEDLPAFDLQFFQRSRLFFADFDLDHSPFVFSPAA